MGVYLKLFLINWLIFVFFISTNLSKFIRPLRYITESDWEFLGGRQVCCDRKCTCPGWKQKRSCDRQPCGSQNKPPCEEATVCLDNYCGGCFAEWFKDDGSQACTAHSWKIEHKCFLWKQSLKIGIARKVVPTFSIRKQKHLRLLMDGQEIFFCLYEESR